jgi:hypothetical protein
MRGMDLIMRVSLVVRTVRALRALSLLRDLPPYITTQHPPLCCGAYGSSFLSTVPQIDGTMKSFVFIVYWMILDR